MVKERAIILTSKQIEQTLTRIAHEIHESHYKEKELILVGVAGRGSDVAKRLHQKLSAINSEITVRLESIQLNKDKPLQEDIQCTAEIKSMKGKYVVLIDDVLNSGKTLIYASRFLLDADLKGLAIATLIDRYHRKFPIRPDYVGLTLSTNLREHVSVDFTKGKEAVYLD
jgi:pyrimidine operon attenuation protein/uracil phosphoribosyltransferase